MNFNFKGQNWIKTVFELLCVCVYVWFSTNLFLIFRLK